MDKSDSTYRYSTLANGLLTYANGSDAIWNLRKVSGKKYLVNTKDMEVRVLLLDEVNWKITPVLVADLNLDAAATETPSYIFDWASPGDKSYVWTDANGDGLPQQSETVFHQSYGSGTLRHFDANLNFYRVGSAGVNVSTRTGINSVGAPIYSDFLSGTQLLASPPSLTSLPMADRWAAYFFKDPDSGEYYCAYNDAMTQWGVSGNSFLAKWGSNGIHKWEVGRKDGKYLPAPGNVDCFRDFVGKVNGAYVVTNFDGPTDGFGRTYAWNEDGLYLGGLLDNPVDLGTRYWWQYSLDAEALDNHLFKDPSGNVYLLGQWLSSRKVWKITGWSNWYQTTGSCPLPSATANNTGSGLRAEYFDNQDLTAPVASRVDGTVNFTWGTGIPTGTGITNANSYSARWYGSIVPGYSQTYTFRLTVDDGARLAVGNRTLINEWSERSSTQVYTATTDLVAGKPVEIQLDFFKASGSGNVKLEWMSASVPWQVIPAANLFSTPLSQEQRPAFGSGVKGEYFDDVNWSVARLTRTDKDINFTWGTGTPDPSISGDYSIRWTGKVVPRQTGFHTIFLKIGNSSTVRGWLSIDGVPVLSDLSRATGEVTHWFVAGSQYTFEVKQRRSSGTADADIRLEWSPPQGKAPGGSEVIPQSQLIPSP